MKRLLLALLLAAMPLGAWATDGDCVDQGTGTGLADEACSVAKGAGYMVRTFLLCDRNPAATPENCTAFDLMDQNGDGELDGGIPERAVFSLETETGCTPSIMVQGSDTNNFTTAHDLLSAPLTSGGTSQNAELTVIPNRYLRGRITGGAVCTDVEVLGKFYYLKKED